MFKIGANTMSVPMSLFADNRKRLCNKLRTTDVPEHSIVLLQGGQQLQQDSTDRDITFRQESFFQWCFGVSEPDCYGAIDVTSGRCVLFIPKLPVEYRVWMGEIFPPSHFQAKYRVDDVMFVDDVSTVIPDVLRSMEARVILTLERGLISDREGLGIAGSICSSFKMDTESLQPVISECRVIKSKGEIDIIRYVSRVSSEAHKEIMRRIRPGWMEYQAESLFRHLVQTHGGGRHVFYDCVASSGPRCAIMNYGGATCPNDHVIEDGTLCLFDMSGEYCCYGSDITNTFPANGKFTEDQKAIYHIVLEANMAVKAAMRPGGWF
ncbi:xaa-Pro dipeptidase-like [Ciona intestinalis]